MRGTSSLTSCYRPRSSTGFPSLCPVELKHEFEKPWPFRTQSMPPCFVRAVEGAAHSNRVATIKFSNRAFHRPTWAQTDLANIFPMRDADLNHETHGRAIHATFNRRGTELPREIPLGLTGAYWGDPTVAVRWNAFVRKHGVVSPLDDLRGTCQVIVDTVGPMIAALASSRAGPTSTSERP